MKILWFSLFMVCTITSCSAVKPYERQFLSDPDMQMQSDTGKNFSAYIQSIREGATPAASVKGSGGCGCN